MRVVYYEKVQHATPAYGRQDAESIELISPLQLRSFVYLNVERFAHLRIYVPRGTTEARIEVVENPVPPSTLRNWLNSRTAVALSSVLMGSVLGRLFGVHRAVAYLVRNKSFGADARRRARLLAAEHRHAERQKLREKRRELLHRFRFPGSNSNQKK